MNFEQLIQACEQAHNYLQGTAVSAVNQSLTIRNWLFGHYIVEYEQNGEDRAKYGTELLKKLAERLGSLSIKGLSDRSLRNCRQFYLVYPQINLALSDFGLPGSIWQTPSAKSGNELKSQYLKGVDPWILLSKLSFSHIIELAREEDPLKKTFYETQAIQGNWSLKELQRQIGSLLYERTGLSTDKKGLILDTNQKAEPSTPEGIMRDPYVFEFVGLEPKVKFAETELEEALINHLQVFLLELGKGFCFEARQKRLTIDGEYYYVDLVFYHRILKCHVLIDLKTRKFHHTDAGQMNFYLNYYRDNEITKSDNPPIGILLCTDKKSSTVKYATGSLDTHLFVSRYKVQLPTVKELEEFINRDVKMLEGG
ncbi:MAG: PDDEXK nuclease domain-containing protein [Bacteroidales bacterium]